MYLSAQYEIQLYMLHCFQRILKNHYNRDRLSVINFVIFFFWTKCRLSPYFFFVRISFHVQKASILSEEWPWTILVCLLFSGNHTVDCNAVLAFLNALLILFWWNSEFSPNWALLIEDVLQSPKRNKTNTDYNTHKLFEKTLVKQANLKKKTEILKMKDCFCL